MVLTATSVAGLDEKRYHAPQDVDFDRKDKRSLVFGRGPHSCIGAYLARTELRAMLSEWLKRIPEFSLKRDETPIAAPGSSTVLRHLPLVWKV
jgi:cytochrome P450